MKCRPLAFICVGAVGFLVQMAVLTALTRGAHWPLSAATALAVEAAVLTNFFWHDCWTWRDLKQPGGRAHRLWRFHIANGATSILGNVVLTTACVKSFGAAPLAANALAVVLLGAANYAVANGWVFAARGTLTAGTALLLLAPSAVHAAAVKAETVDAWNGYVASVERSLPQHESDPPLAEPEGRTIGVPSGTIHQWRGSVTVPHATVGQMVDALLCPERQPLQADVAEVRVLSRHGDALHLYLKLVRKVIVTVTYDTEHDVRYLRRSASFATSRSVATKLVETGGSDRGFLQRLNSYWRYRQVGDAVQIDVLSISLSRDVPWIVKAIAEPLISRIGRESMSSTLVTVQRTADTIPGRQPRSPSRPRPM